MNKRKYLTRYEINSILDESKKGKYAVRDYCMLLMCFIHGFRVSELCKLKIDQIDLNTKSLFVNRLKRGLSTTQPLIDIELNAIIDWLKEREFWRDSDSPWLFLSQKDGYMSRQNFYNLIKNYAEKSGVKVQVHPHMLRHSCGYALADLGKDTRLIQDYLGHKNITHTVIYTASNLKRFNNIWDL